MKKVGKYLEDYDNTVKSGKDFEVKNGLIFCNVPNKKIINFYFV